MPTSRDRPEPGVGSGLWTCSSTAGRFTWELGAALPQPVQTSAVVTCISGLAVLGIELTIQMNGNIIYIEISTWYQLSKPILSQRVVHYLIPWFIVILYACSSCPCYLRPSFQADVVRLIFHGFGSSLGKQLVRGGLCWNRCWNLDVWEKFHQFTFQNGETCH